MKVNGHYQSAGVLDNQVPMYIICSHLELQQHGGK